MEQTIAYQCPNCGAGLKFNAEKQCFDCEFCLSEFTQEQVLDANTQEAQKEAQAEQQAYNDRMQEYRCPNCGAEIVADEHTAAGSCCYCHNPVVLVGRLSGELKPRRIVPFRYDREEAKSRFLKFVRGKWFVPSDFRSQAQIEHLTGIYYPFWITDADAKGELEAHATRLRVWRSGKVEYTETSNFQVHRRGNLHFEDITTSALSDADKRMLEGILPYPSEALQAFSMPYLSGYIAKKRNLEREQLSEEVRGRMERYTEQLLRGTVSGYSTVNVVESRMSIGQCHWEYSLLPIWMLTYRDRRGKNYTYAMNGHTGKVYGELPVSWWKLGVLLGAVTVVMTGLLTWLGGMFF